MWGLIHAMLYIPFFLRAKIRQSTSSIISESRWFPNTKEIFQMGSTFFFTMIAWVFFRSENINGAFNYLLKMTTEIDLPSHNRSGIIFVLLLVILEWILYKKEKILFDVQQNKSFLTKMDILKYIVYYLLVYTIFFFSGKQEKFIYFQF